MNTLKWCDDIIVFDSYSKDKTIEIAKEYGARIFQHPFVDYGAQREAARKIVDYKNKWVFSIDADERFTPELVAEVKRVTKGSQNKCAAFRVRRKDHFQKKWIKHSTLYPTWFTRLYLNENIYFPKRRVHEHPVVNGAIGKLNEHLEHYSFNKGLTEWIEKHNKYAEMEALEALKELKNKKYDIKNLKNISDPTVRRKLLKSLSYRMPLRPLLRFSYMYFLRRGFLDGQPGFDYCMLMGFYEYMIILKMREMREE